ncbi:MAG: 3-isopropylmalate dehydratase small subunit [Desulforegulaceae bacterium]|nr:3-isopropylmalate dehydratase small subunit [Desulforegulaceae bacterium]
MKNFNGKVLFLDRDDINTDEIIPARYLTEISKEALKPYLLEDLKLEGLDLKDIEDASVIITKGNFGCGSSREHAPWAFEVNGINLVIAKSFARIFRQNMFNCGMMAVTLESDEIEMIFSEFLNVKDVYIETDFDNKKFTIRGSGKRKEVPFSISEFDSKLVKSGGWVDFADKNY